jgi:dethiobiotin synthetase
MRPCFIVTGTDTGIGKTVFAAALVRALDGVYWKPVQAGLTGETDSEIVRRLSGLSQDRILPEAYRLATPASPHVAAKRDGIEIDVDTLTPPDTRLPLVIEGAGGLMVPLTRHALQIDLFAFWGAPVIVCASTKLGTINHSLLSIEALKRRALPLLGIAFIGEENAESERAIVELGQVHGLGRLPHLDPLDAPALHAAFDTHFRRADFVTEKPS